MVLGLGTAELLVIGVAFLLMFGPERIPAMANKAGFYAARLRREYRGFRDALDEETREKVEYPPPKVTSNEIPPGHD